MLPGARTRRTGLFLLGVLAACGWWRQADAQARELTWSIKYDPKTLDPAKVDDQAAELVRYLTGGVLLRVDRRSGKIEPELAESWTVSPDGRLVTFHLRNGLRFSDGSPLEAKDVVFTLARTLDPATQAPVADEFLTPREVSVDAPDRLTVRVHLPKRLVSLGKAIDEIAIEPANRAGDIRVTAGPYALSEYRRGEYLRLRKNTYFWRRDASGVQLPYLATLRLDILGNREQDEMRFVRGQYQLIDTVPPEEYRLLAAKAPGSAHDLGPSLNTEQMWFNQAAGAPLPAWEKEWFKSRVFRVAVSASIHRADLARIAYDGHATPAFGFISPLNRFWYNSHLQTVQEDSAGALRMLEKEGFRREGGKLLDREGHAVKFSILTNAGNAAREKMAVLIQQDLAVLGMEVTVVKLDFPALIERLMHTQAYEAALLGLANVDPDPSSMMNVWLSSSPNHQWDPAEKSPVTDWEAEIDRLMTQQSQAASDKERKRAVDRVQQIVSDEQPFLYLVFPNALYAVSPLLEGVDLTVVQPGVVSSIETMRWKGERR